MLKLTGCTIPCAYATGDAGLCTCPCGGAMHGALAEKPEYIAIHCSPAAEKRCKTGNESGACQCACGGVNHGLYQNIPDFDENVRITGLYA